MKLTKRERTRMEYELATNMTLQASKAAFAMWKARVLKGRPQEYIDGFWAGHKIAWRELGRTYDIIQNNGAKGE